MTAKQKALEAAAIEFKSRAIQYPHDVDLACMLHPEDDSKADECLDSDCRESAKLIIAAYLKELPLPNEIDRTVSSSSVKVVGDE